MPVKKQEIIRYHWRCSRCNAAEETTGDQTPPVGWCRLVARHGLLAEDYDTVYELCVDCTSQWNDKFLYGEQLTDV